MRSNNLPKLSIMLLTVAFVASGTVQSQGAMLDRPDAIEPSVSGPLGEPEDLPSEVPRPRGACGPSVGCAAVAELVEEMGDKMYGHLIFIPHLSGGVQTPLTSTSQSGTVEPQASTSNYPAHLRLTGDSSITFGEDAETADIMDAELPSGISFINGTQANLGMPLFLQSTSFYEEGAGIELFHNGSIAIFDAGNIAFDTNVSRLVLGQGGHLSGGFGLLKMPVNFTNNLTFTNGGQAIIADGSNLIIEDGGDIIQSGGNASIATQDSLNISVDNQTAIFIEPNETTPKVGIGTNAPASVLTVAGDITPSQNDSFELGSPDLRWKELFMASVIDVLSDGLTINNDGQLMAQFTPGGTLLLQQDLSAQGDVSLGGSLEPFSAGQGLGTSDFRWDTLYVDSGIDHIGTLRFRAPSGDVDSLTVTPGGAVTTGGGLTVGPGGSAGISAGSLSANGAVSASTAAISGPVDADSLSVSGNATVGSLLASGPVSAGSLTTGGSINAADLLATGLLSGASINVSGDAVLGGTLTADAVALTQPLEISEVDTGTEPTFVLTVNGTTVGHLDADPAAPNLLWGHGDNVIASGVKGSVITGGGFSGSGNRITDDYAVIGGGAGHEAGGEYATISGGVSNVAYDGYSVVAGGSANVAGTDNGDDIDGAYASIGGGVSNTASGQYSVIAGGHTNEATASLSMIGGGLWNDATAPYAIVVGGLSNVASAQYTVVGGGIENSATGTYGTVSGGRENTVSGQMGAVGGGQGNTASAEMATIGGGFENTVTQKAGTVGGGVDNLVTGRWTTIGGGWSNEASDDQATVGGGHQNTASGWKSTVAGGYLNTASGVSSTVGGGNQNTASSSDSTVGGGHQNIASYLGATIAGGGQNEASAYYATVAGGGTNGVTGGPNRALDRHATVGGGASNTASGIGATVPGGLSNKATADYSFASGRMAQASHAGSFVWADATDVGFASTAADEFSARATGGVRFVSAVNGTGAATAGATLAAGSGTWSSLSDQNMKENVDPVDSAAVLKAVAGMPISEWNYIAQGDDVRHMGPMAQDFYGAFGLGPSDKSIDTVDADGVALAAIQGLAMELDERDEKIAQLEERLAELEDVAALEERLAALEAKLAGESGEGPPDSEDARETHTGADSDAQAARPGAGVEPSAMGDGEAPGLREAPGLAFFLLPLALLGLVLVLRRHQ